MIAEAKARKEGKLVPKVNMPKTKEGEEGEKGKDDDDDDDDEETEVDLATMDSEITADSLADIARRMNYAKYRCNKDMNERIKNMSRRHKRDWHGWQKRMNRM